MGLSDVKSAKFQYRTVGLLLDLDGDGVVNFSDLLIVKSLFIRRAGSPGGVAAL